MKNNIFKTALGFAAASMLLVNTGCNKLEDFGNTNTNPLGSTNPITAALLTNVESQLGGYAANIRPSLYVQYIAETQYTDASLYAEPNIDLSGNYSGPMYDLQSIINRNSDPAQAASHLGSGSNANQIAVAKILKSYIIWAVTDRAGDVPYSEALKGAANLFPAYDKQEDIYTAMFADLEAGIAGFDGGLPVRGDVIFGGDASKWKKFANTLRMHMAMRLSKKFPAAGGFAANQFAAAANDPNGFITSNADNMVLAYPGGAAYRHPWYDTYNGRSDYALSKTLADILSNMGDGRRNAYGSAGSAFPYGLTRDQAVTLPTSYAKVLADGKRLENSPIVIMSAAYSLLNLAEGIERGWVASGTAGYTAQQAYEAGITASFDQWGITGAPAYISGANANFTTGTGGGTGVGTNSFNSIPASSNATTANALERIALQKYLALYPDGIQAWSEWRRTGIPALKPTTLATNSDAGFQIPSRYVYAPNEYSLNLEKVEAAVARIPGGEDVMNAKVWWNQ
ncbi:MAG TPA: SusD/RagB family nutrient-binding outer membrane lipoprotein [Ferruginibacter sp.]|nr:SusD/RagB family nutrient-binding outer membrane lipoprotein [Ferruginibacter sp.]HRE63087.1 SusD/RagB family nutrient-binding outer membrane lipoprotein [Ferruginibacter sp.]